MRRSSDKIDRSRKPSANVAEIKAQFSSFLRQVASGKTITVMNRDRPVAQLVPPPQENGSLRIRKPSKDPAGLVSLLDLPAVKGRRTDSLKLLLDDRGKR